MTDCLERISWLAPHHPWIGITVQGCTTKGSFDNDGDNYRLECTLKTDKSCVAKGAYHSRHGRHRTEQKVTRFDVAVLPCNS